MTTFEEEVKAVLKMDDGFNDLPYEERVKIIRYTSRMQILTLYQVMTKNQDLTTPAWRRKIREWLKNCVHEYREKYREKE